MIDMQTDKTDGHKKQTQSDRLTPYWPRRNPCHYNMTYYSNLNTHYSFLVKTRQEHNINNF